MKQPNGCSTPAPKCSAAKQWIKEELAQTKKEEQIPEIFLLFCKFRPLLPIEDSVTRKKTIESLGD